MKILLVEDEAHVVSFIMKGLTEDGFEVSVAMDGKVGLEMFHNGDYDLVILDIMLPEMNGLEVCKAIRQTDTMTPIIFLTALGTSENIVLGLNSGADDYLVKPFKFIELKARIRTLLRRIDNLNGDNDSSIDLYKAGDIVINDTSKEVFKSNVLISLTTTEYRLLLFLIQNKNRVMSRVEILEKVWELDFNLSTNVVDVYVNYLRKKVDFSEPKLIQTVKGMGYVLKEN